MVPSVRDSSETSLQFRDFTRADIAAVHEYASDPLVTRWSTWGPNTLEQTAPFVEAAAEVIGEIRTGYSLAAVLNDNVIGSLAVWTKDFSNRNGELGYTFHRAHWGKGYATESVGELLRLGFNTLKLERIGAICHPDNMGSIRVLEKNGFTFEGRLRSHRAVRGTRRDSMLFSILREEYAHRGNVRGAS
ncbi:Protein N-acetyltransferase, RimJ/RimL family [Arthrobacter alpinus]|uniref:Protein N-acetyltransferase, RimJ/RimL family n=1 Tax=Arthrobacter alpinus TaxID=656366 RepID=A0A1H5IW55_9MICC|nr:GNAT family N-acetyltransferase [Arthrobacter alpinus]SEE44442.1 Protein N-acetyltransferase, RimJ/RimL family [Arthrobacter alpinus]